MSVNKCDYLWWLSSSVRLSSPLLLGGCTSSSSSSSSSRGIVSVFVGIYARSRRRSLLNALWRNGRHCKKLLELDCGGRVRSASLANPPMAALPAVGFHHCSRWGKYREDPRTWQAHRRFFGNGGVAHWRLWATVVRKSKRQYCEGDVGLTCVSRIVVSVERGNKAKNCLQLTRLSVPLAQTL